MHCLRITLSLLLLPALIPANELEAPTFPWGGLKLVDETFAELSAKDFSADFAEDVQRAPEIGDTYDEKLAELPSFEMVKNGKKLGYTRLPIVTRKKPLWSTRLPTHSLYTTPKWDPPRPTSSSTEATTQRRQTTTITTTATTPTTGSTFGPKIAHEETFLRRPLVKLPNEVRPKEVEVKPASPVRVQQRPIKLPKIEFAGPVIPPHGTEVRVQSQQFVLRPPGDPVDTSAETIAPIPFVGRRFHPTKTPPATTAPPQRSQGGWSRSWKMSADGKLEVHTWDGDGGERVEQRQLSPAEQQQLLGAKPKKHFSQPSTALRAKLMKPAFIQAGGQRYRGPTYNCRVLEAETDGKPSASNDPSCPLLFPGIAADDSCKCTYEVSGRDENQCATGFTFTCLRLDPAPSTATDQPFAAARQKRRNP